MNDYLIKTLSYNQHVRIYVARTTKTINEIGDKMQYYPSALASMGRVLTMGVIMGSTLKGEESITLKVEGNGPIGLIMVEANSKGEVRAYAQNPHCHFEYPGENKLNVKATVGDQGFISVIKDLKLKEPFVGTIPIISGELAEDFAYYYHVSEQIPSAVSLGVLVDEDSRAIHAGGFLVQLLPNTPDNIIDEIETKVLGLPPISEMLQEGLKLEEIARLLGDETTNIIEHVSISFKCKCSKESFARGIISLGYDEIKEMIEEDKEANTLCHFCGNEYHFSEDDLKELLKHTRQ